MVELADNNSPTTNRNASTLSDRGVASHYDDLPALSDERLKQHLANELASELWSRLPISRVAETSDSRGIEHTIQIATASTSQVQRWYQELSDFVPHIAKAAIELRGEKLSDTLRDELSVDMGQQILEQIRYPLPSHSFVDFKFADLPPTEAWIRAQHHLKQACLEFANHVFALLDSLQQKNVIGQIQETSSTCRFTFFRRVAIAAASQSTTEKRTRRDPDYQIPGHPVFLEETFEVSDYDIQHRHARHVHHVRSPVLNRPCATTNPLPEKYSHLIDACPNWLTDSVRILEGELFRAERIEWDLQTELRRDERVIERVRRCPAVLFGPYILAGWGELEISEEESRQREEQNTASRKVAATKAKQCHWLSLGASGLAIAVIPLAGSATVAATAFAILLGLLTMFLAGIAAHLAGVARNNLSAGRVLLHSTTVGAIVFAVQGATFSLLHWSLFALGMAVTSALLAAAAFKGKTAITELDGFRDG